MSVERPSDRTPRSDEMVERYRAVLPAGDEAEFEITNLDHLGVPVWSAAVWPDAGPFSNGVGYGIGREEARLSAYGELFESVNAWLKISSLPRTAGSYEDLAASRGPRGVLDPREACLPAGSPYTPRTVLEWVPMRRYPSEEEVLVPVELAATRFADLGGDPRPGARLITPITNGLGAGPNLAHALSHALLELVQRDGNSVAYRALDRGVAVDLDDGVQDPGARHLLETIEAGGVDVTVKLAHSDLGMANLYAVGTDRDPAGAKNPLISTACGEAAHPSRAVALRKCLAEFCAARARRPFNHGPLGPIEEISPPGYVERFRTKPLGSEEDRSLEETLAWLSRSYEDLHNLIADPVLKTGSRVAFSTLPDTPLDENASDFREKLLETTVDRLAANGLDVLYLDLSPANEQTWAVKALVPGLEVETMSYGRIGPRNLRRLLERGSGFGGGCGGGRGGDLLLAGDAGGRRGARRVLLTPEREAELGPAWLDLDAVERAVGDLYPLYREPGRHVAALAAEERGIY